jgi:hypothetical protein
MGFIIDNVWIFALCGMLGPVLYTAIWILGGIIQPEYSHIRDDVSSLMAVGAPNKGLFDAIHTVDVLLMIVFFASLNWILDTEAEILVGPICFLASNVLELAVGLFFPLDEGGEIGSKTARTHVALVGIMATLAILGMIGMWLQFRDIEGWGWFSNYSLAILAVSIVTGLVAAKTAGTEVMGLTERFVVTTNAQYMFVFAMNVLITSL